MYGVAALVLLHCSGSLGGDVEGMLVGPLLMLSAAVGALAAGLPLWMLPAPLLAASGLAMFYDTAALRDYLLFVAGELATGGRAGGQVGPGPACCSAWGGWEQEGACLCGWVCQRVHVALWPCSAVHTPSRRRCPHPHAALLRALQAAGLCGTTFGSWTLSWRGCTSSCCAGWWWRPWRPQPSPQACSTRVRQQRGGRGVALRRAPRIAAAGIRCSCQPVAQAPPQRAARQPRPCPRVPSPSSHTCMPLPACLPAPADAPKGALGAVLLAQAALVCWLEERLYAGDHQEVTYNLHAMYPPWLVMATSGERRRRRRRRGGAWWWWGRGACVWRAGGGVGRAVLNGEGWQSAGGAGGLGRPRRAGRSWAGGQPRAQGACLAPSTCSAGPSGGAAPAVGLRHWRRGVLRAAVCLRGQAVHAAAARGAAHGAGAGPAAGRLPAPAAAPRGRRPAGGAGPPGARAAAPPQALAGRGPGGGGRAGRRGRPLCRL